MNLVLESQLWQGPFSSLFFTDSSYSMRSIKNNVQCLQTGCEPYTQGHSLKKF